MLVVPSRHASRRNIVRLCININNATTTAAATYQANNNAKNNNEQETASSDDANAGRQAQRSHVEINTYHCNVSNKMEEKTRPNNHRSGWADHRGESLAAGPREHRIDAQLGTLLKEQRQ
jgi:hypothetical protein